MPIFFHGKGEEKLFFVLFVAPFFSEPFATPSEAAKNGTFYCRCSQNWKFRSRCRAFYLVERLKLELSGEFVANPSLQPVAEHEVRLSIPAQQVPQQASQHSGRWAGLNVRRLPANIAMALLNHLPRHTIKMCQDLLAISACALMDWEIIRQVDKYDATVSVKWTATLGLAMVCNYGIYRLDKSLTHYFDKVALESLDSGVATSAPHGLLTSVTTQVECKQAVAAKIRQALEDGRMSSTHLHELLRLFRDVITLDMVLKKAEFLKIDNILTMLSTNPAMTPVAANQAVMQMGYCDESILNALEQVHVWVMTETLFETFNRSNNSGRLMVGLQSAYAESVFLEAMQSVVLPRLPYLFDSIPLVGHSQSVMIYALYKRILFKSGACKFLARPPHLQHNPITYFLFAPNSTVFYQFLAVFLEKLADVAAFLRFARDLIVEKEDLFLRNDHQLRQRIDQKREQNCSELAQLARLEVQGEITENQYIESSNHLMDRHKHEMGEIWLGYVSKQFSRLPEMAKTILHNDHNIPLGLLTMELASAYI